MITEQERKMRWRMVLGRDSEPETGSLTGDFLEMDEALSAIYNAAQDRRGGLGGSSPKINRWLGDIRKHFPSSIVRVMQKDALERLGLKQMLMEPEILEMVEPDIHLVATLISLGRIIPSKTKATARLVVKKLVDELMQKIATKTIQSVRGSLNRATRTNRPRHNEINFDRTIRANLKNWQPEQKSLIVDRLIGYGNKRSSLRDIVLCVDQSGSMAPSVVYSSIFAAVLASVNAVSTKMVVFDTSIADLTELLADPVDVLFGTQLGGGTDINRAIAYCQQLITRPAETIFVLITDLYEGGNAKEMISRAAALVQAGVTVVCLLALCDDGAPWYDEQNAAHFSNIGIPTFACTPDLFPDLMAAAIGRQDISIWAGRRDIVVK